jgi:cytochrome P450
MSLLPTAVDEMIRWVTPVKHFMRNATVDYELAGVTIKEGESVLLSYPSANRDEKVFADPFHFDVGRTPNKRDCPDNGVTETGVTTGMSGRFGLRR